MDDKRGFEKKFFGRLAVFIDYHNLEGSLRNEGCEIDLPSLLDYLTQDRRLLDTFVYIGFDRHNCQEDEDCHRFLRMNGCVVRTKAAKVRPDGSLKCDLDIELTLDVVDFVSQAKPDIVVLVTGDGDFVPLVNWLRLRGIRVEVASTPRSIAQDLAEAANGYVDLCEAIEEIGRRELEIPLPGEEVIPNGNGNHQRSESGDTIHVDG